MATFPSIRIEGGLLAPDVFDQLLGAELPGQKPSDFGLGARRTLTEDIAAAFSDARALWGVFQNRLARLPEADVATSVTRDAWAVPFLGLLGYDLSYNAKGYSEDGQTFAISHRAGSDEDAPPVHIVGFRQELGRAPESGRPRLAPHSLVQDYLNRSEHVWGLVTNGRTLRLLRDTTFVRRQSYIEFDLENMLEEQRFDDFSVLFRLLHRTRLPKVREATEESLIERYYQESFEQGGRVRDHLRDGVEECLKRLAGGFLDHPQNGDLRRRLTPTCAEPDRILPPEFYRQLLRLIYRFLFLLVSEDRGLISPDPVYREHYGVARLRRLLDNRAAYTDHDDVWQGLRVLWRTFASDTLAEQLKVAPLNGELFEAVDLDRATIANRDFLDAFWWLAWYRDAKSGVMRRVNYGALDVEELGSVYESLLEFHPRIERDGARLTFQLAPGSERKTTGSYYTPPALVNELVHSALDPVIEARLASAGTSQAGREKALLAIRVCDPACGSGHFLLAAARRIGRRLAAIRTGEDEPAPERVREAVRDVIRHSIYGVDKNPLAVDLCRVALWLESHTGGKPLTFLDHRIRCGDSLVGVFDLDALAHGIPDKAFSPLEGDDKSRARAAAKENRAYLADGQSLFAGAWRGLDALARESLAVGAASEDTPTAVRRKRELYEASRHREVLQRAQDAADLWTGAFFQRLVGGAPIVTSAAVVQQLTGGAPDPQVLAHAAALAERHCFFHWPLEFPEVFADGGFDSVLGNPPWKVVEESGDAEAGEFERAKRWFSAQQYSVLSGRRDLYKLFLVVGRQLLTPTGRLGFVIPVGALVEEDSAGLRALLFEEGSVTSVMHLQNSRRSFFSDVDSRYRFACMALSRDKDADHRYSLVIHAPSDVPRAQWVRVPRAKLRESYGESLAAVLYPNARYFAVHQAIDTVLRQLPPQQFDVVAEFHATTHSGVMTEAPLHSSDWRILKNRSIHQYDPRFGEAGRYITADHVARRCAEKGLDPAVWLASPRLLFRDIARSDDARTLICCVAPVGFVSSYDTPMFVPDFPADTLQLALHFFCGLLNSFVFDFLVRPYVDKHIKGYVLRRLPVPRFDRADASMMQLAQAAEAVADALPRAAVGELDELDLLALRAAVEVRVARLANASSEDMGIVMDSFSIVKEDQEKRHGRYVIRDLILASMESAGEEPC